MPVNWTTEYNKFPEMQARLSRVNGRSIIVGAKGEHAWLASIHEYGCHIPVTKKMRGWLAVHGLRLKKTTTEIIIPDRSFLRAGYDANLNEILEQARRAVMMLVSGVWTSDDLYNFVGTFMRDSIQKYARDLSDPPKHPFTLEMNGGAENPLVHTGDMINSIEFSVE